MIEQVMPHSKDVEKSMVCLLIITPSKSEVQEAAALLTKRAFHIMAYQRIFEAYKALLDESLAIDYALLVSRIAQEYHSTVAKVLESNPDWTNARAYARELLAYQAARDSLIAGVQMAEKLREEPTSFAPIDKMRSKLGLILEGSAPEASPEDELEKVLQEMREDRKLAKETGLSGLTMGIQSMDHELGGWKQGLHFIGGRQSMGKTSLALSSVLALFREGKPQRFVSLDMNYKALILRVAAQELKIPVARLDKSKLDDDESAAVEQVATRLMASGFVFDGHSRTVDDLVRSAMATRGEWEILWLDYIQLLAVPGPKTEYERLNLALRKLKALVLDTKKPIVILSQLTKQFVPDSDGPPPRPALDDLKGSGDLTDMATTVLLPYRPAMRKYGGGTGEEAEIIIAKRQQGPTKSLRVLWNGPLCAFGECESYT